MSVQRSLVIFCDCCHRSSIDLPDETTVILREYMKNSWRWSNRIVNSKLVDLCEVCSKMEPKEFKETMGYWS